MKSVAGMDSCNFELDMFDLKSQKKAPIIKYN